MILHFFTVYLLIKSRVCLILDIITRIKPNKINDLSPGNFLVFRHFLLRKVLNKYQFFWYIPPMVEKTKISEADCLSAYLTMGNNRSLPKLREHLSREYAPIIPPSLPTLKRWSSINNWKEAVNHHETATKEQGIKLAINQTVSNTKERLTAYNEVLNLTTDNILKALKSANISVENSQDLTAHINTIEKLQKLLNLLQGEATERTETNQTESNLFDSIDFNSLFQKKIN